MLKGIFMKALALICLLLAGCASAPTNSQQTGYTSPEPGFLDYLKGFGELAGELVVGLASAIAENADSISGAVGAYSDARSGGADKASAYQAASQALSPSGTTQYGGGTSGNSRAGAGTCNREARQLSVGEFLMCAADDCRQQGGSSARGGNKACYGCVINGLTMWTRCHPSSGGVSSAT